MIDFRQLTCPRCKLESPATAEVCDCGYLLTAPPDKQPVMGRVAKGPSTVRAIFAMLGIYILGVILLAWCVYFLMVYKGWATETTLFDPLVLGTGAGSVVATILLVIGLRRRR